MPANKLVFLSLFLLFFPFVAAAGPRLVINQFEVSPKSVPIGETFDFLSVQLQNAGDADCSVATVKVFFADSDNSPLAGVPVLEKFFFIAAHEWKTVLFSETEPPAPDIGSIGVGTFVAIAEALCDSQSQDEENAFFSVYEKNTLNIPETNFLPVLLVAIVAGLLLFSSKKRFSV
jgi:hypothetical protein